MRGRGKPAAFPSHFILYHCIKIWPSEIGLGLSSFPAVSLSSPFPDAGNLVLQEVIGVCGALLHQHRDDVPADAMPAARFGGSGKIFKRAIEVPPLN
jgi:hypothetical protein